MEYLHWKEETITDFSESAISQKYNEGFVFTRIGKGVMHQTRSVRIDLSKCILSSENRRVLKKIEGYNIEDVKLPYSGYHWTIGKLGKDFYEIKFGQGIFSSQKIKETMVSDTSNFNLLLKFADVAFVICHMNKEILHYSYPFYDLMQAPKDMGLGMMTKAIVWAKEKGLKYVYLGSLQRPGDVYKLQFAGLEWFDGSQWKTDLKEAKEILEKNT